MAKRKYVRIKEQDNVVVVVQDTAKGTEIMDGLTVNEDVPQAHKVALMDIPAGGEIIRGGFRICNPGYQKGGLDQ